MMYGNVRLPCIGIESKYYVDDFHQVELLLSVILFLLWHRPLPMKRRWLLRLTSSLVCLLLFPPTGLICIMIINSDTKKGPVVRVQHVNKLGIVVDALDQELADQKGEHQAATRGEGKEERGHRCIAAATGDE